MLYGASNYYSVMYVRGGKPTYWFITWKDHWSIIYMTAITFVFTGLFYLTATFDEMLTGRSSSITKTNIGYDINSKQLNK